MKSAFLIITLSLTFAACQRIDLSEEHSLPQLPSRINISIADGDLTRTHVVSVWADGRCKSVYSYDISSFRYDPPHPNNIPQSSTETHYGFVPPDLVKALFPALQKWTHINSVKLDPDGTLASQGQFFLTIYTIDPQKNQTKYSPVTLEKYFDEPKLQLLRLCFNTLDRAPTTRKTNGNK